MPDNTNAIEAKLDRYRSRASAGQTNRAWATFAAAGSVAASSGTAEAVIVHVTPPSPVSVFAPGANSGSSRSVDLVDNSILAPGLDLEIGIIDTGGGTTYGGSFRSVRAFLDGLDNGSDFRIAVNGYGSAARALSSGQNVSTGALDFSRASNIVAGAFVTPPYSTYPLFLGDFAHGGSGLVGFRFGSTPVPRYGWIRIDVETTPAGLPFRLSLLEWAYELDVNTPIAAGDTGAPTPDPAGDYNDDGVVDIEDYTVWRDSVGQSAGALPNDEDGGVIDNDQYTTWVNNFGATESGGPAVPEPIGLLLLATGSAAVSTVRAARRG
ncbi:MAG: hypothetical protein AAFV43_03165 [Planctomycetota bacterium]